MFATPSSCRSFLCVVTLSLGCLYLSADAAEPAPKPKSFLDKLAGRLSAEGKTLRGQVTSEDGTPLANAKVTLGFGDPIPYAGFTDKDGRFEIKNIPVDKTRIYPVISAAKHVAKGQFSFELKPDGDTEVVWKLAPAAVVTGRVTRKSDGSPVKGISIIAGRDRFGSNHVDPSTVTDDNGEYRLEQVPLGDVLINAFSPDFAPLSQTVLASESKPATANFEVEPGKPITGRVTDPDGKPVKQVWIVTDTWNGARMFQRETHTKEDGTYRLENMPSTPTEIHILKKDYISKRDLQGVGGANYDIVIYPVKDHVVKIRLADKQEAPKELVIHQGYLWPGRTEVNWQPNREYLNKYDAENGTFTIRQDEQYNAKMSWRFRAPGYREVVIDDPSPGTSEPIEVTLRPAELIKGTVVDAESGAPIEGVTVALISKADRMRLDYYVNFDGGIEGLKRFTGTSARTKADGEFEMSIPDDIADKDLLLIKTGTSFHYLPGAAELLKEVTTLPFPSGSVLEGQITIAGKPSAGEVVHLGWMPPNDQNWDLPFGFGGQLTTDSEGRLRFDGLGPGRYRLSRVRGFNDPGAGGISMYMSGVELIVEPGKTVTHDIAQPAGHTVTGRVLGKDGKPIGNCIVTVAPAAKRNERIEACRTDTEGNFTLAHLPADKLTFTVQHYSRATAQSCGLGNVDMQGSKTETITGEKQIEISLYPVGNHSTESIVGQVAPDFSAKFLDATDTFTLSDHLGKLVVIDFWATWCGPCMAVMPQMKEIYEKYRESKDVVFLTVSLDQDEEMLRDVMKEKELAFPVIFDGKGWQSDLASTFGVHSIPSTFVVGRDGKFASDRVHASQLADAIDKALKLPIPKGLADQSVRTPIQVTLEGSTDSVPGCTLHLTVRGIQDKVLLADSAKLPDGASRYVWRHPPLPREAKVVIHLEVAGCQPIDRIVPASATDQEISLMIACPHLITGTVVLDDEKTPVSGVEVLATRSDGFKRTAKTDDQGQFALGVLPGEYSVYVKRDDHFARIGTEMTTVTSAPEGQAQPVKLLACKTMDMAGQVLDAEGKPVGEADVGAYVDGSIQTKTDAEGKFTLKGLPSRGSIGISASKDGKFGTLDLTDPRAEKNQTITLGVINKAGLAVGMQAPSLTLFNLTDGQAAEYRPASDSETLIVFAPLWHPKGKSFLRRAAEQATERHQKLVIVATDWSRTQAQREYATLQLRGAEVYFGGPGGLAMIKDWHLIDQPQAFLLTPENRIAAVPKPGELPPAEVAAK